MDGNTPVWLRPAGVLFFLLAVENFEGFFGVGGAEDEESVFFFGRRGAVGVFDVDFGFGEFVRDVGKGAGLVGGFDHEDFVGDDEDTAVFEEAHGSRGIADDKANDDVVDGVAG